MRIRVLYAGNTAAHIDEARLDGAAPHAVSGALEDRALALRKLARRDFDVIDAQVRPLTFTFRVSGQAQSFSLAARIESVHIGEFPFQFPVVNTFRPVTAASAFYTYIWNSRPGRLTLDGDLARENLGNTPFFREFSHTGSGHPSHYTYGWVRAADGAANPPPDCVVTLNPVADPITGDIGSPVALSGTYGNGATSVEVSMATTDGQPLNYYKRSDAGEVTLNPSAGTWSATWFPAFNGEYTVTVTAFGIGACNPKTATQTGVTVSKTNNFSNLTLSKTGGGLNANVEVIQPTNYSAQQQILLLVVYDTAGTSADDAESIEEYHAAGTEFTLTYNTGGRTPYVVFSAGDVQSWSYNSGTGVMSITGQSVAERRSTDNQDFPSVFAFNTSFNPQASAIQGAHFSTNVYRTDLQGREPDQANKRSGINATGNPGWPGWFKAFFPTSVLTSWGIIDPATQFTGFMDGGQVSATVAAATGGYTLQFNFSFASTRQLEAGAPAPTPTPTSTPTATATSIPAATPIPTPLDTPTPAPTSTSLPTATPTPQGQTHAAIGAGGGTASNPTAGMMLTFSPGALPDGATVTLRPLGADEIPMLGVGFSLLGAAAEVVVRDANGNILTDFSAHPVRLCFSYTDAQLLQAGGDTGNLTIFRNPGQADQMEITRNRTVDTASKQVCVDVTQFSTWALAARVPTALPVTGGVLRIAYCVWLMAVVLALAVVGWGGLAADRKRRSR